MKEMTQVNEQQAFEIELRKELDKFFPEEFIPANFQFYATRALQYQSIPSLKIGIETYEKLLMYLNGTIDKITFYEVSFLINAIGSATPHQLGSNNDIGVSYITAQKDIIQLSNKWNSLVDPIKESTRRKVHAHIIRGMNPTNGKIIH